MPRYYIDVWGHFGVTEDLSGIELPDVVAARTESLRVAEKLLVSWGGMLPEYCEEIVIKVVNDEQCSVLTIPYSEFASIFVDPPDGVVRLEC